MLNYEQIGDQSKHILSRDLLPKPATCEHLCSVVHAYPPYAIYYSE